MRTHTNPPFYSQLVLDIRGEVTFPRIRNLSEMTPPSTRKKLYDKARGRIKSNKVISRLTYCPKKHKQRKIKDMRQSLQNKKLPQAKVPSPPSTKLKFASFNVNGLGIDTCWSVQQLLDTRGFDVRNIIAAGV